MLLRSAFVCSAAIVVSVAAAPADGQLRSELSLGGHTVSITYAPEANSIGAANLTNVARLETNASLRIGDVAIGKQDPAGVRYDVSLAQTGDGWRLVLAPAEPAGQTNDVVGIPLNVGPTFRSGVSGPDRPGVPGAEPKLGPASGGFVAALVPESSSTGRLLLRWANNEAAADVALVDPPRTRRTAETTPPNTTVNRTHDEDTSVLSRARLLAQRNETVIVLPDGKRLGVSFQRTFEKGDRVADSGRTRGLPVYGPDFTRLASTADQAVVMLTEAAVPRLTIEAPLQFGRTVIRTGNQVAGFPGSYGIWLKRAGPGWRLVFNNEPDAWGSQHDRKFDAAEVELRHAERGDAWRPFAVSLVPTGADRGRVLIIWGQHEWSADFVVAG